MHRNCHARANVSNFSQQGAIVKRHPKKVIRGKKPPSHKWREPRVTLTVMQPTEFPNAFDFPRYMRMLPLL